MKTVCTCAENYPILELNFISCHLSLNLSLLTLLYFVYCVIFVLDLRVDSVWFMGAGGLPHLSDAVRPHGHVRLAYK
jgi:hypothetical protein